MWSPDGKWLAFQRGKKALVMPASGGRAREVATGRPATWSPNARRLAVVGGGLFVVQVADWTASRIDRPLAAYECNFSHEHRVAAVTSAAWSHGGQSIAFTFDDYDCLDGEPGIAVVASDGHSQQTLVSDSSAPLSDSSAPQWSQDDAFLFFLHGVGLERARPDGSDRKTIRSSDVDSFALSPDGKLIAYATSSAVGVTDIDGAAWRQLLSTGGDPRPVWRP